MQKRNKKSSTDWTYEGKPISSPPEGEYGFVYIITHIESGRRYLGQKRFYTQKTKTTKTQGKIKKTKVRAESNWQSYYGSSTDLLADVKQFGAAAFTREIIRFCSSISDLNYYEAKYQFQLEVLESDLWYNKWISIKTRGPI